jgi:hypothetical protein
MKIRITDNARRFGYIKWDAKRDGELRAFIGGRNQVHLRFVGGDRGVKMVDWKWHRMSVGWKQTRGLATNATYYELSFVPPKHAER